MGPRDRLVGLREATADRIKRLVRAVGDRIRESPDWLMDLIDATLLRYGIRALGVGAAGLLITELLCFLGVQLPGSCRHFITLNFIQQATTLSFSLAAFLLVSVVVVSAVGTIVAEDLDIGIEEFELTVDGRATEELDMGESTATDAGQVLTIVEYEGLETGRQEVDWDGLARWGLHRGTDREIAPGYANVRATQLSDSGDLALANQRYAVRPLQLADQPMEMETDGYDHRIKGRLKSRPAGLPDGTYFPGQLDSPETLDSAASNADEFWVHWLLREPTTELRPITLRLRRAVVYSLSASLGGVIIQGYPWVTGLLSDPWLTTLSAPEDFVYIVLSYVFTAIFLGMLATSVGLIELMTELVDVE